MKKLFSLLGLVALIANANAQGTFEAITGYSAGSDTAFIPGTGGWTFQPTVDMTITDLGCLDILLTQGTIDIGLWTDAGQILGGGPVSITPTNSSPTQPQYSSIQPVFAKAGQTYRLGAFPPASGGSFGMSLVFPAQSTNGFVNLSADVKMGSYAYTQDGLFGFPATLGTEGQMLLGPTFLYTKNVPEPAILALLGLGGLALLICRRGLSN